MGNYGCRSFAAAAVRLLWVVGVNKQSVRSVVLFQFVVTTAGMTLGISVSRRLKIMISLSSLLHELFGVNIT